MTNEILIAVLITASTTNWHEYYSDQKPRETSSFYTLELTYHNVYEIATIDQEKRLQFTMDGKTESVLLSTKTIVPDPPLVRSRVVLDDGWIQTARAYTNLPISTNWFLLNDTTNSTKDLLK